VPYVHNSGIWEWIVVFWPEKKEMDCSCQLVNWQDVIVNPALLLSHLGLGTRQWWSYKENTA